MRKIVLTYGLTRRVAPWPFALLPFLALFRTYNTGIAFSLFASVGDVGLIAISAGVILFVLYLASRTEPGNWIARTGFALIVGGALGNLIDRVYAGYVLDFFDFYWRGWHFWAFNIADASITIGVALMILDLLGAGRSRVSGTV